MISASVDAKKEDQMKLNISRKQEIRKKTKGIQLLESMIAMCSQAASQPDISHFLSPIRITSYSCSLI